MIGFKRKKETRMEVDERELEEEEEEKIKEVTPFSSSREERSRVSCAHAQ